MPVNKQRKALLERMYLDELKSIRDIAAELGRSTTTIHRWMAEDGIERREPGRMSNRPDRQELAAEWEKQGRQMRGLAVAYGRLTQTVRRWLLDCGLIEAERPTKAQALGRRRPAGLFAADDSAPVTRVASTRRREDERG